MAVARSRPVPADLPQRHFPTAGLAFIDWDGARPLAKLDPAVTRRRAHAAAPHFQQPIQGKHTMKLFLSLLATAILAAAAWAAEPVNVNTASAEEIAASLTGIGPSKARLIVEYREANGSFMHVDELVNVKGIGIKTVDQNRGMILLSDDAASESE